MSRHKRHCRPLDVYARLFRLPLAYALHPLLPGTSPTMQRLFCISHCMHCLVLGPGGWVPHTWAPCTWKNIKS